MSEASQTTAAPQLYYENGVPVPSARITPRRPLAPSQALTTVQETRVRHMIEKAVAPLLERIAALEKAAGIKPPKAAAPKKGTPPKPQPPAGDEEPKTEPEKKTEPTKPPVDATSATSEVTPELQAIIDCAATADLKRALTAIAKQDLPEDVRKAKLNAALAKYQK